MKTRNTIVLALAALLATTTACDPGDDNAPLDADATPRSTCSTLEDEATRADSADLPDIADELVARGCDVDFAYDGLITRFVDRLAAQAWDDEATAIVAAIERLADARVTLRLSAGELCNQGAPTCEAWCNGSGTLCIELKSGGGNCQTYVIDGATVYSCAPWYPAPK